MEGVVTRFRAGWSLRGSRDFAVGRGCRRSTSRGRNTSSVGVGRLRNSRRRELCGKSSTRLHRVHRIAATLRGGEVLSR